MMRMRRRREATSCGARKTKRETRQKKHGVSVAVDDQELQTQIRDSQRVVMKQNVEKKIQPLKLKVTQEEALQRQQRRGS